jgi:hypothetical protein
MLWTDEHAANLKKYLETRTLPQGLGDKESACSIAAINLAINGKLTDDIPDCMSEVLGEAIIPLQDAIPGDMRNSDRYRAMLQRAPGTGRDKEEERVKVLMDWMWGTVLPQVQPYADKNGFGDEWRKMCKERTREASKGAAHAAHAAYASAHSSACADAARASARVYAAAYVTFDSTRAAHEVAYAARSAAHGADFWQTVDTIGVLERMIEV